MENSKRLLIKEQATGIPNGLIYTCTVTTIVIKCWSQKYIYPPLIWAAWAIGPMIASKQKEKKSPQMASLVEP